MEPEPVATLEPDGLFTPSAPPVLAAEPGAAPCVVGIGPVVAPEVSDVVVPVPEATAAEVVLVELVFAAEAEFAPTLQAVAAITTDKRIERYIFPDCG